MLAVLVGSLELMKLCVSGLMNTAQKLSRELMAMTPILKNEDWLFKQLQNANFAAEYLNAASEDDDPQTY